MQKPVVSLTLAYAVGILIGHGALYFPIAAGCLLAFGLLTAVLLVFFHRLTPTFALLIAIPCLIGASAYLYSTARFPADHYTRSFSPDRREHDIAGIVSSPPERDRERTTFTLDLCGIDSVPVSGVLRVSMRGTASAAGYGDLIRTSGKLYRPAGFSNPGGFDYAAHLARNALHYALSVRREENIAILSRGSGIIRTVLDWRERIRQAFLASTTGQGSAILQAMVIGEEGDLAEDTRDQFMAAGVTHIISISGSHLAMMALLCFGLIRGVTLLLPEPAYHRLTLYADPRKAAAWLTLPLVIFYTLLAGGQVATVRSLIMISAGLMALILDRDHALLHSLTLAALSLLAAAPQTLFDISFQLSYLSVLVIAAVVTFWNELGFEARSRLQRLRNSIALAIIISLATALATGPLAAHYFNQFSLAGIVANLFVVPFAGFVIVPMGLCSGLVSLVTHSLPRAWLNQGAADSFLAMVSFFSRLPFAEFHLQAPGIPWLVCYAVFLLSLASYARPRLLAKLKPFEVAARIPSMTKTALALSGTVLILSAAFSFLPNTGTMFSFLDVGQGDCTVIELASGKTILVDGGGTRDNRFDIGRRVVAPYLWNRGVRTLDLVVLSHPHPDHLNGMLFLLRKFKVRELWSSGLDRDLPAYEAFCRIAAEQQIPHRFMSAEGPPVILGNSELKVLHPTQGFKAHERKAYAEENDRSVVVRITDHGRVFLFPGDIGEASEISLADIGQNLKCDVLKVPHHGSKSSSTGAFVSQTRPGIAVMTAGRDNPYRHPSQEVIVRYEQAGSRVCRTDADGAIIIREQPGKLDVYQWNDLTLRRIRLHEPKEWKTIEKENVLRTWMRISSGI